MDFVLRLNGSIQKLGLKISDIRPHHLLGLYCLLFLDKLNKQHSQWTIFGELRRFLVGHQNNFITGQAFQ